MIEEPNSRDAKADMTPARKNFSGPALAPPDNDRAATHARKQTRASKPRGHADAAGTCELPSVFRLPTVPSYAAASLVC
ncbi:hypothetical protein BOC52_34430 [Burkholderia pseudomallei]|nr:hypothetical protein BOC52_34430 [Burkholderia pseudomallei]ARL67711.1 hypothetical protein BOC53_31515 [Burkholderia pseudomallei]